MKRQTGKYERTHFGGEEVAAFVPEALPPPLLLPELLTAFEKCFHANDALPSPVRACLLPVQFETMHPDLDGNGQP